jgi:hypothetical protein
VATAAPPETEDEKTIYALGVAVARNLAQFNLSPNEVSILSAGLTDALAERELKVDLDAYGPKIDGLAQARLAATAAGEKDASVAFVEAAPRGQRGQRRRAERRGSREGALPRHAARRHRLRQLRRPRHARRVRAQPGDPVLD